MKCPKCGTDSSVVETRHVEPGMNRRRRACDDLTCGYRFTTLELPVESSRHYTNAVVVVLPRRAALELQSAMSLVTARLIDRMPLAKELGGERGDAEDAHPEDADADALAVGPDPRVEEPATKPRE